MALDWDELRLCRVVFEERGLRKAADRLGMSHATLRRRLDSLEASLGVTLFDRRATGLFPTPAAEGLMPLLDRMADDVATLRRRAAGLVPTLEGWVHLTLPEMLASELLAAPLASFCQAQPTIQVRVEATERLADLAQREADLAIRILARGAQPDEDLIAYPGGPLVGAVYGEGEPWIGFDDMEPIVADLPKPDAPRVGAFNSVYLQKQLCRQGSGRAFLPCFMADGLPRQTLPRHVGDVWVLVHPDQRRNPRVRLLREHLTASLAAEADRLDI